MRRLVALLFVAALAISSCHAAPPARHAAVATPPPAAAPLPAGPLPEAPIVALETAILAEPADQLTPQVDWDRSRAPSLYDLVFARLALTRAERRLLGEHGFVVRGGRTGTYSSAFYDIQRGQLPVYISASAIANTLEDAAPKGALPSFMKTKAYDDLRHRAPTGPRQAATMQPFDESSDCADGWLEPRPEVYRGIARTTSDPEVKKLAEVLATIAEHELAGHMLTDNERHFLERVNLWYGAFVREGDREASLGIFVVDAGGPPRLAVGPVPVLTDKPYVGPASKELGIAVGGDLSSMVSGENVDLAVATDGTIETVTVELLDHHGVAVASRYVTTIGIKSFKVSLGRRSQAEGLRVRSGDFNAETFMTPDDGQVRLERGGVKLP